MSYLKLNMSNIEHANKVDWIQVRAQQLFGSLTAVEAAKSIMGFNTNPFMVREQKGFLYNLSAHGGTDQWYLPDPVKHIGFHVRDTQGCGNRGTVVMVAHSAECKAIVTRQFQSIYYSRPEFVGVSRTLILQLWNLCRGHIPTTDLAAQMFGTLSALPSITDSQLRRLGFKPKHPHHSAALTALRTLLQ